ncbi:hypothetical protein [Telluribacter sp. SYSU D00476]|uniref:hypothetical protein n=1 Tax=Telluribacter sp. SYSU D00476 TaxID=2811430 RepID=UPI001FF34049|nr:hypothetical protein [Telluribacter sp. SYSU D00476]
MKKSNIFAYVELSKLVGNLHDQASPLKEQLRLQAAYFNIIDTKFFSDQLARDWQAILGTVKPTEFILKDGRKPLNQVSNTISTLTEEECRQIVKCLRDLHQKLEAELKV